jgi:hypothetical protein
VLAVPLVAITAGYAYPRTIAIAVGLLSGLT